MSEIFPDPWAGLRAATPARIGLGRSGDGLPTRALLEFQLAHAKARDAVHGAVDFAALATALQPLPSVEVESEAGDRLTYLRRPDLGRRLSADSAARLPQDPCDIVFIIGDGLSAAAVTDHAIPVLKASLDRLGSEQSGRQHTGGWRIGPVVLARQARVALSDPIGAAMGAALAVMLIGERPGLSVANSLGVYLTWNPRPGRSDAERNCISNIHADGLRPEAAADKLTWLAVEALRRGVSGVALKDESSAAPLLPRP